MKEILIILGIICFLVFIFGFRINITRDWYGYDIEVSFKYLQFYWEKRRKNNKNDSHHE